MTQDPLYPTGSDYMRMLDRGPTCFTGSMNEVTILRDCIEDLNHQLRDEKLRAEGLERQNAVLQLQLRQVRKSAWESELRELRLQVQAQQSWWSRFWEHLRED